MNTEPLGFSILTAPLAAIDRRALSQAWYSALHDARDLPQRASVKRTGLAGCKARSAAPVPRTGTGTSRPPGASASRASANSAHERARVPSEPAAERRAARSSLARDIERTFLHPLQRPQRASFVVDGEARVHVTLQSEGHRVRLVAVCAPSVRRIVAHALAQARFALAARGVDVALAVRP